MFFIEKGWHPVHFQYGGYAYANGSKEQGIFLTWTRCYEHVHVGCRSLKLYICCFSDGFAFSQDETSSMRQSQIVRLVDTRETKPTGE